MIEIWRSIPGYEEYYEVSNLGRVRRVKGGCGTQGGRILKGVLQSTGYQVVTLSINSQPIPFSIHRLVATAFLPNPENKPCVNHINGVKTDNRVENLEWTTYQENNQHAWRTGLNDMTVEHRRKISESNKGRQFSEETRKKISEALTGRKLTANHKEKLSEAHKGKPKTIWINNGYANRRVIQEELQRYLDNGYVLGRMSWRGQQYDNFNERIFTSH
jgi:hypothetical protein